MNKKDIIKITLFFGSGINIIAMIIYMYYVFEINRTDDKFVFFLNFVVTFLLIVNILVNVYSIVSLLILLFKKEENKEITNN